MTTKDRGPTDEPPFVVLVVDDEPDVVSSIQYYLQAHLSHARVLSAADAAEAREVMANEDVHLVLCDLRMPGDDGLRLLREVRDRSPRTVRILMTAYPDMDVAVRAVNEARVHRFIVKPLRPAALVELMRSEEEEMAIRRREMRSFSAELDRLRRQNAGATGKAETRP